MEILDRGGNGLEAILDVVAEFVDFFLTLEIDKVIEKIAEKKFH